MFQKTHGWIVKQSELEKFFIKNLQDTGFIQNEIDDFIEYWVPKLVNSEFYSICPQYNKELDPLNELIFSKQPDSILRISYYIKETTAENFSLHEPVIPEFKREGFVATEWGVIPPDKFGQVGVALHE